MNNKISQEIKEINPAAIEAGMAAGKTAEEMLSTLEGSFKTLSAKQIRNALSLDISELEKNLQKALKNDLKSGTVNVTKSGQLGKEAKDASKLLAMKEIMSSTKPLKENEIVGIINRNIAKSKQGARDLESKSLGKLGGATTNTTTGVPPATKQKFLEKLKNMAFGGTGKVRIAKLLGLTGIAVAGAAVLLVDNVEHGKVTLEDATNFPDCVKKLLDLNQASIEASPDGMSTIINVKSSEYATNGGGVKFYTNGTCVTFDGKKKGTYTCKGGNTVMEEINIEFNNDVNNILESFNKIININDERKKSIILEQSSELTTDQLTQFIDTAVNDLDGWVDRGNLQSLKTILTNLRGKTYQGKPALNAFLDGYKLDEHGDDFINDVSKISTNTFDFSDFQIQKEVIRLAQAGSVSTGTPQTKDGNLSGIKIVWGTGGQTKPVTPPSATTPVTPKPTSKYHDCTDLPFQFGCKSDLIRQVQRVLMLPEKYQTGNFGPITLNKLKEFANTNNWEQPLKDSFNEPAAITKAVYDKLMNFDKEMGQPMATPKLKGVTIGGTPPVNNTPQGVNMNQVMPGKENPNNNLLAENITEIKDMFKRIL